MNFFSRVIYMEKQEKSAKQWAQARSGIGPYSIVHPTASPPTDKATSDRCCRCLSSAPLQQWSPPPFPLALPSLDRGPSLFVEERSKSRSGSGSGDPRRRRGGRILEVAISSNPSHPPWRWRRRPRTPSRASTCHRPWQPRSASIPWGWGRDPLCRPPPADSPNLPRRPPHPRPPTATVSSPAAPPPASRTSR